MGKQNEKASMSTSQQKRLNRKKENEKAKNKARLIKISVFSGVALLSVGLLSLIGYNIYTSVTTIKPSSDYSANLDENGKIEGVTATDSVDLADYSNMTVPLSEIEYSDESVDTDIKSVLKDNSTLETETEALIADGDTVNIDYVGSIDGVEFEGGNSNGEGSDLEIGSGSFIDDFEEQLIGHGVGETVTVEVTFPTDYGTTELAGKDAVFEVVINGIYSIPEFTDAFVKENLSDYATTVDEYRQYLKDTKYDSNLTTWIDTYLMDNTTVLSYPEDYINHLKSIKKYEDQSSYEYMNQLYTSMGYDSYSSFEEYTGMSETKYDASLLETVQEQAKKSLIYQAILESEGMTVTADEYLTYFVDTTTEDYDSHIATYGDAYAMQEIIAQKVMEFLKGAVTVE